jgi:UDP-N-acetylmuramoyl-tripeptide--D-alanyl-D-alanine ligase
MRMRTELLVGGVTAINDAYNANPASMEASLRALAALAGRRIAVLGDMLELGADEGLWHGRIAALAGSLGLDLVVLTGPRMSRAAPECLGAASVWAEADPEAVAPRLRTWLAAGDHVLFKGSRGARVERILQSLRDAPTGSEES